MQGFNHIAGGIAFTGIFSSFVDVNIFEKPEYLGVTVFCSILPDIDHTRSVIGKFFYPLAKWLNSKFGHRTITHSLIFWLASIIIIRFFELLYNKDSTISTIAGFAILSHNLFDMCTIQGVPFFYPFSKRPVVLPGNRNLRLRTNDFKSEAIIFVGFVSLIFFCMPLFANGFWQVYRKSFLNYKQLNLEVQKSKDMLEIEFITKENEDTLKGTLISLSDGFLILHRENKFYKFENPRDFKFIDYKHTNKGFKTKEIQLFGVSEDSLKAYINAPFLKAEIQCNQDMNWFEGAILKTGKNMSFEYQQGFNFTIIKVDKSQKFAELEIEKAKKLNELNEFQKIQNRLDKLYKDKYLTEKNYRSLSDYEKGKALKMIEECKIEIEKLEQIEPPFLLEHDKRIEAIEKEIKSNEIQLNANFLIWIRE